MHLFFSRPVIFSLTIHFFYVDVIIHFFKLIDNQVLLSRIGKFSSSLKVDDVKEIKLSFYGKMAGEMGGEMGPEQ